MEAVGYFYIYLWEAYFLWNFATCLFPKRCSTRRALSVLSALYLIIWSISFLHNMFLSLFVFAVAAFLFLYLCFALHWTSAVFHAVSLTLTMSLSEFFCLYLYDRFLPDYWDSWYLAPNLLLYGTLRTLPYFLATLLLIGLHQPHEWKNTDPGRDSASLFLIIPGALSFSIPPLFVIGLNPWLIDGFAETLLMLTLLFILLILFLLYALQAYDQQKNAALLELQTRMQKERDDAAYYQLLAKQSESQNLFIHDIKNHLQSIAALNNSGERDKLSAYVEQLVQSESLTPSVHICDNNLLNSILYRYVQRGKESGVNFHPDIRKDSTDFLSGEELTSLFCNLLDNAFDAASKVRNGFIDLRTEVKESPALIVLTLANSCVSAPLRDRDGALISTKPNASHHGLGMKNVERIVNQHGGQMQDSFKDSENCFYTVLTFPRQLSATPKEEA